MSQQPPEINFNLKEPYPNFFMTLHELMLGQIEFTRLRVLIIKIAFAIVIINIILVGVSCILTAVVPIFGISILAWLLHLISKSLPTVY
jgi:hypothetical protein